MTENDRKTEGQTMDQAADQSLQPPLEHPLEQPGEQLAGEQTMVSTPVPSDPAISLDSPLGPVEATEDVTDEASDGHERIGLVVLGMHRSGTSALTGLLGILGCDQSPEQYPGSKDNEKGYFESIQLNQLNEALLASAGSYWDDWLEFPQSWLDSPKAEEFSQRAQDVVREEFGSSRLFIFKDPRVCRMVPYWQSNFERTGISVRYIVTLRNPLEVAASLHRRDKMNPYLGYLLWLRHALDAEAGSRGALRTFTSYTHIMQNWTKAVEKIQQDLHITLPKFSLHIAPEVEAFLTQGLRHHVEDRDRVLNNFALSSWIRDSYEILERWSESGEDSSDYATLDRIRDALNKIAPAFAPIIAEYRDNGRKIRDFANGHEQITGHLNHLTQQLDARNGEINQLAQQLQVQQATQGHLNEQLNQARAALQQSQQQIAALRAQLDQAVAKLQD